MDLVYRTFSNTKLIKICFGLEYHLVSRFFITFTFTF